MATVPLGIARGDRRLRRHRRHPDPERHDHAVGAKAGGAGRCRPRRGDAAGRPRLALRSGRRVLGRRAGRPHATREAACADAARLHPGADRQRAGGRSHLQRRRQCCGLQQGPDRPLLPRHPCRPAHGDPCQQLACGRRPARPAATAGAPTLGPRASSAPGDRRGAGSARSNDSLRLRDVRFLDDLAPAHDLVGEELAVLR